MAVLTAVRALKGEPVEKRVTLPGQLFTRLQPNEVSKYRDHLRGLAGR